LLATTVWETLVFVLPRSQANPGTTIAVDPVDNVADPGNSFSVDVTIAEVGVGAVTDVYSYQVKLGFDKTILTPVFKTALAMEGPYLRTYAEDNLFNPPIPTVKFDNPDYVYFADALFGPAVPGCPEPSGVLFTVEFQVKAAGVSTLDVFGSIILSYDGAGTLTEHYPPADFAESDGNFHTNYPVAAFSFSPNTFGRPIVGENVTFDGSASTALGGATIVSYVWNFSDGSPLGSGMIVKHVFSSPSTISKPYNVTLTVTDNNGLSTMTYKKNVNEQVSVKRHDIAIIDITEVTTGDILVRQDVQFDITVLNNGTHSDAFNVTSFCNERAFNTTKFPTGSIDLAPGQNVTFTVVLKTFINQTTILPSQKGTGSGWFVDALNASISDDLYSNSSTNQATQDFSTYREFDGTGWEAIAKVEVGLEVKTDSGGDDMISVQVFTGLGWTPEHFLNVTSTTDTFTWIDVTGNLTWLPRLLQQNRAVVKLKYIQVGPVATPIYVDYLPLRITPTNPLDLPAGSYDL
jgi:PKD repeat protein